MNSILAKKIVEAQPTLNLQVDKIKEKHQVQENVRRLRDKQHARFRDIERME